MIAENLDDKIQIRAQAFYTNLIQCCSLVDPKQTISTLLPILTSKLLIKRKKKDGIDLLRKNALFYFIEKHPDQEAILEYELEEYNKEVQLWYLNLIEDVLR